MSKEIHFYHLLFYITVKLWGDIHKFLNWCFVIWPANGCFPHCLPVKMIFFCVFTSYKKLVKNLQKNTPKRGILCHSYWGEVFDFLCGILFCQTWSISPVSPVFHTIDTVRLLLNSIRSNSPTLENRMPMSVGIAW